MIWIEDKPGVWVLKTGWGVGRVMAGSFDPVVYYGSWNHHYLGVFPTLVRAKNAVSREANRRLALTRAAGF